MSDVSGRIVNFFNGNPVVGATVMFGEHMATTDANGNFFFQNLPPAVYEILIIHRDFEKTMASSDLRVNQAYTLAPIRVKPIFRAL